MLTKLRRAVTTRPRLAGVGDLLLTVAVPYTLIGVVVTALHLEFVRKLEAVLAAHIPVFFDLLALGFTLLFWPVVLIGSLVGAF